MLKPQNTRVKYRAVLDLEVFVQMQKIWFLNFKIILVHVKSKFCQTHWLKDNNR